MSDKIYLGIDLGKEGGFYALKNGKPILKEVMPKIGKDLDLPAIGKILLKFRKQDVHVIFESIKGLFGISKGIAMDLSEQKGIIEGMCVLLKLPYTVVGPKTWQKAMFSGAKIQTKTKKVEGVSKTVTDTKATATLVAKRLFPQETFLKSDRSKKPHDGLVDACLLAEYGRRRDL